MASNNAYGPQVIVDDSLILWYDMNSPKCWTGGTTLTNLGDRVNFPSISPYASAATNMAYIDFINNDALPGRKYIKITGASGNDNTIGNFMTGAGDMNPTCNGDHTVMGWLLSDSYPAYAGSTLLAYRRTSQELRVAVASDAIRFRQRHYGSPYTTYTIGESVTNATNSWDHYAMSKVGGYGNAEAFYDFYKNGEHLGTETFTMSQTSVWGTSNYDMGADWSDDDYVSNNMAGYLGPMMCYQRGLSHAEIKQNYNALRSRFGL